MSAQSDATEMPANSDDGLDAELLELLREAMPACISCGNPCDDYNWCRSCESARMRARFSEWTSENPEVDAFLRDTQLNAITHRSFLEWIPFEGFCDINFVAHGGFSSVYSGIWLTGPRWTFNNETKRWERDGKTQVALKVLNNSRNIAPGFLDEVSPTLCDHALCSPCVYASICSTWFLNGRHIFSCECVCCVFPLSATLSYILLIFPEDQNAPTHVS
jgi:hypothetical protein